MDSVRNSTCSCRFLPGRELQLQVQFVRRTSVLCPAVYISLPKIGWEKSVNLFRPGSGSTALVISCDFGNVQRLASVLFVRYRFLRIYRVAAKK